MIFDVSRKAETLLKNNTILVSDNEVEDGGYEQSH